MHSEKLNSTQLNCSVQLSFPLCIEPATTCDDSATKSTVVAGSSQSGHTCESADQRNVCRWMKTCDGLRRRFVDGHCRFLIVKNLWRRLSQLVAGSMHSGKLNWTIQFSSVQLSSVQLSAVHWALQYMALRRDHRQLHLTRNAWDVT